MSNNVHGFRDMRNDNERNGGGRGGGGGGPMAPGGGGGGFANNPGFSNPLLGKNFCMTVRWSRTKGTSYESKK